jgi:hypothetical protein
MSVRFNAPPGWPVPSSAWAPGDEWMPDPSWPAPPEDWEFWTVVDPRRVASAGLTGDLLAGLPVGSRAVSDIDATGSHRPAGALGAGGAAGDVERSVPHPPRLGTPPRSTVATYGTDRGTWLARLRAAELVSERAPEPVVAPTAPAQAAPPVDATVPESADPVTPRRPAARQAPEEAWAVDGLRFPVSRVDA